MKKCPFCAEEIQDAAIVCRYCGRDLPDQATNQTDSKPKKKSASSISKLGVALIVVLAFCGLCIFVSALSRLSRPAKNVAPTEIVKTQNSVVISTFTAIATQTPAYTNTPRPSPTLEMGIINEPREAGGIVLTVLNMTKADSIDFLTPDPGNTFLIIDVSIENVGRNDEAPYNPLYFSVKDSDNYEFKTSFLSPDPSLRSGTLPKGGKVRGFVAFEIRSISTGLVVTYKPLVILGGYEPIRINLEKILTVQSSRGTPESSPCDSCNFECPGSQGEVEFCLADPELLVDTNLLERTVNEYCNTKGGNFCKFLIWTDSTYIPASLPISDLQLANQVADYTRNTVSGIDCLKLLSGGSVIYSSEGCN